MIQRAQSIYLGLAFICMVLLLFFPIFSVEAVSGDVTLKAVFGKDGVVGDGIEAGVPLYGVFIVLALITAAGLLMYKKRPRQLLLTRISFILHLVLVVGIYLFYYLGKPMIKEAIETGTDADVTINFYMETGFFMLIPTIAFLYLAIRGIRRDEKLVKSLDRLR